MNRFKFSAYSLIFLDISHIFFFYLIVLVIYYSIFSTSFHSVVSIFDKPTDGIIFEEVTNRGYHIQFDKTGLNYEQSVLALQKLACFHAASAVVMEEVSIN